MKVFKISKSVLLKEYVITNIFLFICFNFSSASSELVMQIILVLNLIYAIYLFWIKSLLGIELIDNRVIISYLYKFQKKTIIISKSELRCHFVKEMQGKGIVGSALEIKSNKSDFKIHISPILSGFKMNKLNCIYNSLNINGKSDKIHK
jgi:hypothetical protein